MSKTRRRWTIVGMLVVFGGVGVAVAMHESSSNTGVAVVEVYTSEGCSSCPPADAVLAKLVKEARPRVYPLAFHVDYWDTAAWRDAYSDPEFSRRQEGYAKSWGERGVYTPEMIVNGSRGFVGSEEEIARTQIVSALKEKPTVTINAAAAIAADGLNVDCKLDGAGMGNVVNAALVERGLSRKISGGENAGRSLVHENVVRAFQTQKITGTQIAFKLTLPADAAPKNCSVIVFVQDNTMRVLGANAVELYPSASH